MTKPVIEESRWAELGDATPSANLIEPTSGKKDVGWVDDESPDADQVNWHINALFQWAKYLDGGIFDGPISVDGAFTATSIDIADYTETDRVIHTHGMAAMLDANWSPVGSAGVGAGQGPYIASTASGKAHLVIPVRTGDRVKTLDFKVIGDGSADLTTKVYTVNSSMTAVSVGSSTETNPGAAWADATQISLGPTTITSGDSIVVEFAANAGAIGIGNVRLTLDHP